MSNKNQRKSNQELEQYKKKVAKKLSKLTPILKKMALGNFSQKIEISEKEDEFTELLETLNLMVDDFRGMIEKTQETKESVSKERDQINTIINSIGDGVFVVDKNLNIIIFNKAAAQICGYLPKEVIGERYDEVLKFVYEKDKKTSDEFIKEVMETGENKEMSQHTVLIKKNGTNIAVADSAAPLKDKKGGVIGCVVVFRDATKEREVDKAKTEFVSLASHQLRTPLSAINWYAEMLLAGDAGKINKDQKSYLEEIYSGNKRMVDLVNSLLNVSRLELGTFAVEPRLLKLQKVSDSILEELKPNIRRKKIGVSKSYDKNLSEYSADPQLVRMIIQNLLSNAVKYTQEKGKVDIKIKKDNSNIKISVSDNGYGIPKSQQKKIFTKLFRADNVYDKETEGTGLGLYIVKSIIDHCDSKIWFKSKENEGTIFYVSLPLSGMKRREGLKKFS